MLKKLMIVQALYFGLLPLLLIDVAFSLHTNMVGKKPPLFQFDVSLTLLSVFSHPKHLELVEAAACVPGHHQAKGAVH